MLFLAPRHLTTAADITVGLHKLAGAVTLVVTGAMYIKVCTIRVPSTLFGILVDTISYYGH